VDRLQVVEVVRASGRLVGPLSRDEKLVATVDSAGDLLVDRLHVVEVARTSGRFRETLLKRPLHAVSVDCETSLNDGGHGEEI